MWVSPACRGQGVAGRLVSAVCDQARQAGATSVTLWVTDVNGRARSFYRRLGFESTGQRQLLRPGEWEEELSLRV
jgi:ribosomal protein S18 acetylase RimI-like enzyme